MNKKSQLPYHPDIYLGILTEFQQTACRFKARIRIKKGETVADAKSFIEIVALLGAEGETVEIAAQGSDALEALRALEPFGGPELFREFSYLYRESIKTKKEAVSLLPKGEI